MKTLFLILAGLFLTMNIHAQTTLTGAHQMVPIKNPEKFGKIPMRPAVTGMEMNEHATQPVQQKNSTPAPSNFVEIIGNTTYDLQTNASLPSRIYHTNNFTGAAYIASQLLTPAFPDRGLGYNYFDGTSWGSLNTIIDSLAWVSIDIGIGNTEYVLGHYRFTSADDLVLLRRSPAGIGNWTKTVLPPHPSGNFCIWAKMKVGGTNGATIHVIALTQPVSSGGTLANGISGALTYSRSQDGGATWDLVHVSLPLMDSQHYVSIMADTYTLDVRNNVVAITQGSLYNDWILWKSTDNGTTFTRTEIMTFPIPAFDPETMITDVNGDAVPDTMDFIDGSLSILIDNNNMVHCWAGQMRWWQDAPATTTQFITDGLLYWNENSGGVPAVIASTEDIDGSGVLELSGAGNSYPFSLTSMPASAIDGSTNIFVAYAGTIENTTNGNVDPLQESPYRNIYIMASPDNGVTWSQPFRFQPSDFDESIYPSLSRNIGSSIHLVCQTDGEPGTGTGGSDPLGVNDIWHSQIDPGSVFAGIITVPGYGYKVKGRVYMDENQNGTEDGTDYGLPYFKMFLQPENHVIQSNMSGNYTFNTDTGTHTVSLYNLTNYTITSSPTSYTVNIDTADVENLNFGIYPQNLVYDVNTILTSSIPRCNNHITYWITYKNEGTVSSSGTVKFVMDGLLSYESSVPAYTTASADTFTWDFTNLLPQEHRNVKITTSSFGTSGGEIVTNCGYVLFDDGALGGISEDCMTQTIVCSYDPNDKAVVPPGVGLQNYALLSDTLIYTIRFQNTGTDTAFTVRVRDTLSAFLNPSTFRFLASSHPVEITRNPNDVVLFEFENILLPDSNIDEPGSNGFVKYYILPNAGIPIGSQVNNTAHIFFDYNPAIVTNTTLSTLMDVIGMNEPPGGGTSMYIYPNPSSEITTIIFPKTLDEPHHLILTDIFGRIIKEIKQVKGSQTTINVGKFSPGVYFINLHNQSGQRTAVKKVVIK